MLHLIRTCVIDRIWWNALCILLQIFASNRVGIRRKLKNSFFVEGAILNWLRVYHIVKIRCRLRIIIKTFQKLRFAALRFYIGVQKVFRQISFLNFYSCKFLNENLRLLISSLGLKLFIILHNVSLLQLFCRFWTFLEKTWGFTWDEGILLTFLIIKFQVRLN